MFETLGNLGDFVGGIGVIVTVAYLAYQVRQNTNATKSASYQAVVASVSDWSREIGLDKEAVRVLQAGAEDLATLSKEERGQFNLLVVSAVRNFENIHHQYETGAISAGTWEGWSRRIRSFMHQPGVKTWWAHYRGAYSTKFLDFIGIEDGRDPAERQMDGPFVGAFFDEASTAKK